MTAAAFIPALVGLFGLILLFLELRKTRRSLDYITRDNERLRVDNATLRAHLEEFPRR